MFHRLTEIIVNRGPAFFQKPIIPDKIAKAWHPTISGKLRAARGMEQTEWT
jgi:hypothetical protein